MSIMWASGLTHMTKLNCRVLFVTYKPLTSKLSYFDFRALLQTAARWRDSQLQVGKIIYFWEI